MNIVFLRLLGTLVVLAASATVHAASTAPVKSTAAPAVEISTIVKNAPVPAAVDVSQTQGAEAGVALNSKDRKLTDAEAALNAKDWKTARKKALAVLERDKKSAEALTLVGRSYLDEGRPKVAIKWFTKSLKRDPQRADTYYWKGKAYESLGKWDEAGNEYQAAMRTGAQPEAARQAWQNLQQKISP